jgi:hypothetical protein
MNSSLFIKEDGGRRSAEFTGSGLISAALFSPVKKDPPAEFFVAFITHPIIWALSVIYIDIGVSVFIVKKGKSKKGRSS